MQFLAYSPTVSDPTIASAEYHNAAAAAAWAQARAGGCSAKESQGD